MRHVLSPVLGAGLLCFMVACGSSSTTGAAGGGANGGGSSTGSGGCPSNLAEAPNSDFCEAAKAPTDCSQVTAAFDTQVCGVPVVDPTDELARSTNVKEYAGSGPPNLACFTKAGYPTAGTSATVKVQGTVQIFSHGCESKNVTVEIHKVNRSGAAGDPDLGDLVGTAFVTPDDCKGGVTSATDECDPRLECTYEYDGVPSETELVILTKGSAWAPLYDFNIYIPTAEVKDGVYTHNVKALAADDYTVIAQAAIGGPISAGNGAIAGEVHDCDDVRLTNATVNTEAHKQLLTYFTSDEVHPLPETGASSTSILGLYAAIDVPPGPASVAALGLVNGKVTTVGYYRVRVFPDSVTSITFKGLRPFQISQ